MTNETKKTAPPPPRGGRHRKTQPKAAWLRLITLGLVK